MRRFFAARKREPPREAASPSSSSSSSGTPSVHPIPVVLPKRSWKPWTAAKRSLSLKSRNHLPDWSDAPPLPRPDSDPDDSDDDHAFHVPDSQHAIHVVRARLANTLADPLPVPPFVHHSQGPLYPRSINRRSSLPPSPADLRVIALSKSLAARLRAANVDTAAILPLAARPVPERHSSPPLNDIARPSASTTVLNASPGLRQWIARPGFEDRYVNYLTTPAGIDSRPISSPFAIAALEYPEHLDVMVDPDFDQLLNVPDPSYPLEPTPAATHSHAPALDQPIVSAPSAPNRSSYTSTPSPLRNEHATTATATAPIAPSSTELAPKLPTVKRVVRFMEDDSDDALPLHMVRQKKKREEKNNFLRREQLKRLHDEEFAQRQEAQRLQQVAAEKERQRLALEKERKERERAHYAEQVLAARARREISRAGGVPSLAANSNHLDPQSSYSSLKNTERNKPPPSESRRYSRVNHEGPTISIPRREAPDHLSSHPNLHFSDSSSPDSSRPPSLAHSPGSPAQDHSRPPSTYSAHTSSSEDVRHHQAGKRHSLAPSAVPPSYGRQPIIATYAKWSGSNPNIQYVPPVPPFPDYISDMPLLPPTAPFMKHARPRSTSSSRKDSSPGPSTSSSRRGSFNSSSERVNVLPKSSATPSSRNASRPPQQRHASTPSRPGHERRMSGDSQGTMQTFNTHRQSSHYSSSSRPAAITSYSHPVLPRGRSEQSAWSQAHFMQASTNPWMNVNGVPMAVGMPMSVPVGMPYLPVPVYPMMPSMMMAPGPQLLMQNTGMSTPMREGTSQSRQPGDKRTLAIS